MRKSSLLFFLITLSTLVSGQYRPTGLPEDFPGLVINTTEPELTGNGYLFLSPFDEFGPQADFAPYLVIMDDHCTPVFYRKLQLPGYDFKPQPDGTLSYYSFGQGAVFHILDSCYEHTGNVASAFGPGTDFHELRVLENGNYLLIGFDDRVVDMDTVVAGGHPGVTVRANTVEEIDSAGNLVFLWNSWDHYQITDANNYYVNLLEPYFIDFVHMNAMDVDSDTTMLLCPRNLDEITKIDRRTGEIIWRLGGENNMFTSPNDSLWFSMAHYIRRLDNGNYLLFDNGWNHDPPFSSALEYELDEENLVATVVQRIRSNPDIYGHIMGSAQRLPNSNTLVGWGSGIPSITEFDPDGNKIFEMAFQGQNYRALRYPWETNAILFDTDTLTVDEISIYDTTMAMLKVINNSGRTFTVTGIESRTGLFYPLQDSLPKVIDTAGSALIPVIFHPVAAGEFHDVLTVCEDTDTTGVTQRIAKQIHVKGIAYDDTGIKEAPIHHITIGPNPAPGTIYIHSNKYYEKCRLTVTDMNGRLILNEQIDINNEYRVDLDGIVQGFYLVSIRDADGSILISRKISLMP